jgi:hypothetical protein
MSSTQRRVRRADRLWKVASLDGAAPRSARRPSAAAATQTLPASMGFGPMLYTAVPFAMPFGTSSTVTFAYLPSRLAG